MNTLYNKNTVLSNYEGDVNQENDPLERSVDEGLNRPFICATKSVIMDGPLSIKDVNNDIQSNVTTFILPYEENNVVRYKIYCYLYSELKSLLFNSPILFKYPVRDSLYTKTGPDESFPILNIKSSDPYDTFGINIVFNYFLLLRYSAFVLLDPMTIPIGSTFGVSTLHGSFRDVYRIKPISKTQFLEQQEVNFLSLNKKLVNFREADFAPGNYPPYKIELLYEDDKVREREVVSSGASIENIFFNNGTLEMALNSNRVDAGGVKTFFTNKIEYVRDENGYYTKRRFKREFKKELKVENTEVNVKKVKDVHVVSIMRDNNLILKEYMIEWKLENMGREYDEILGLEENAPEESNWGIASVMELILAVNDDSKWDWETLSANPSITMEDIKNYPDKPWRGRGLSDNPNITMKVVNENPNIAWDWILLSENPAITMKNVNENPDKPWKWDWLSRNPNITMNIVKENPDKPWNWDMLSMNRNIAMKDVKENPDKPWDWDWLSRNPNITMKDVEENPNKDWNWRMLSKNLNITMRDVLENPDKHWDWGWLSINPNIKMRDVLENPDKNWNWRHLSKNPGITLRDVKKNPDKPWDVKELSVNPNITVDDVINNPDIEWNYKNLSMGLKNNILKQLLEAFPGKPWNWNNLSANPNITMKDVKDNPDKPWNWDYLSANPNITMKDVKENPDIPWNWKYISLNEFTKYNKYRKK